MVVAIDYFTHLVEVKALSSIASKQVQDFFWEDIIGRYRVPNILKTNNRKQFDSNVFKGFCEELGIDQCFPLVAHPQRNDLIQETNKMILQ